MKDVESEDVNVDSDSADRRAPPLKHAALAIPTTCNSRMCLASSQSDVLCRVRERYASGARALGAIASRSDSL